MSEIQIDPDNKEARRTVLVAFGLAAGFLLWGLALFFMVGVKEPPAWNFGALPDVPGLSAYSTMHPAFLREQAVLTPQHVKGRPLIQKPSKKGATP